MFKPFVLIVLAAALAPASVHADQPFTKRVQANMQAFQFSGVEIPTGYVADIKAEGAWQINPTWKRTVGPGGNPSFRAASSYTMPGANEGCLLVRIGSETLAFDSDGQVLTVNASGKLYFAANDEPTRSDYGQSDAQVLWIHVGSKKDGAGFMDNSGELTVKITLRKLQ